MSPEISGRSIEDTIEAALLANGPDTPTRDVTAVRETPLPYGETPPGATVGVIPKNTTASAACSRVTCSISSMPPSPRSGRN